MRAALDALVAADPRLARIEAAAGPLPWRVRGGGFAGLLQIVVGQQISNQAALAIWRRIEAHPRLLQPDGLLAADEAVLRGVGLSRPKVAHARSLAAAFAAGQLSADALARLPDPGAVAAITAVRGLGPWSAEVYLLFALQRQDVFPAGDIALAGAYGIQGFGATIVARIDGDYFSVMGLPIGRMVELLRDLGFGYAFGPVTRASV